MSYHGDIALGNTIDIKFTTRRFSSGAPFTLAGTPAVSAYVGNSTTQITSGITLSVDFDGVTGLNNVRVVASGANGFTTATDIELVVTAGTVDSVSVVGEVVGSFSIENRSALRPTTAGRTLDVSAGGEAGLDWANVGSPSTTVGLSGTTVGASTTIGSTGINAVADQVWDEVRSGHTTAGTFGGDSATAPTNFSAWGDLGSKVDAVKTKTDFLPSATAGSSGGVFIAGTNAATTVTTSFTTTFTGNLTGSVGSVSGAVGSVTGNVGGNVAGSVASVTAGVTVTMNNDKTGYRLSATGVDDVLDEVVEGSTTLRQSIRGANSALMGKASGLDTTNPKYRDLADSKDRIDATVDTSGNRTAVTRDLT